MKRKGYIAFLLAVATALLAAPAASADESWTTPADVLGENGDQHIDYPPWNSSDHGAPWMTVGAVGDVNGDGLEDVGAGFGDGNPYTSDPVYITFSTRLGGVIDALPGGFKIVAPRFWSGISSAGDVNGDGLGDVAISEEGHVSVVFGKRDGETVDTGHLGTDGFTIDGAGKSVIAGTNAVMQNEGVTLLGDLNGDHVRDLLVGRSSAASIVYPPRNAAGMTINAGAPGPYVSTLDTSTEARRLEETHLGNLGDLDGDGRDDVMVAGEEHVGTDEVAYGVRGPLPGTAVDLPAAVAAGDAFELRTHDGQPGWYGELEDAVTLGDENGDGRREVGMLAADSGLHSLRVAFSPPFGQTIDIQDLGATDARGYRFHTYGNALDVGDQSGDGRGDFASSNYVYFTNPALEDGHREPVNSGFYFSFAQAGSAAVAAPMRDLNLDGKPELIIARSTIHDNSSDPNNWQGQNATYSIDVFDSAILPHIPVPDPPVTLPDGTIEVPVDLGTGAGSRGGASLGLHAGLELADASGGGASVVADGGVVPSGGQTKHLALKVPAGRLVAGREYRVRYVAGNGRGLAATGPWRSFVAAGRSTPPGPACPAGDPRPRRGTGRADRMTGTHCRDVLLGLGGNDSLSGLGGADTLRGGGGRDVLRGGPGADKLYGGPRADRIYARDGRRDVVHCGSGRDTVRADRLDRLVGCERKLR